MLTLRVQIVAGDVEPDEGEVRGGVEPPVAPLRKSKAESRGDDRCRLGGHCALLRRPDDVVELLCKARERALVWERSSAAHSLTFSGDEGGLAQAGVHQLLGRRAAGRDTGAAGQMQELAASLLTLLQDRHPETKKGAGRFLAPLPGAN